ncbi:MAG: nucleotide pyrophosphohydrolase [Azonexus sp.]|jgi:NTP pyrophosphatase (non-canonical NTP hydrolase)|nr:nucleotide pyrophosphohydrolase [Azonexus sp.]
MNEQPYAHVTSLDTLRDALREFVAARDWRQYHAPKNLVMALSVETAELVEIFQWLTAEESHALTPEQRAAATDEIADVLIYLVETADALSIDPLAAVRQKLLKNALKYPAKDIAGDAG